MAESIVHTLYRVSNHVQYYAFIPGLVLLVAGLMLEKIPPAALHNAVGWSVLGFVGGYAFVTSQMAGMFAGGAGVDTPTLEYWREKAGYYEAQRNGYLSYLIMVLVVFALCVLYLRSQLEELRRKK
mmetsp:Transcript_24409/g.59229  ORF Transcript_24409/g.59229 Transcript_24409/m.59229 type:complete len:126 (+) Transcript_24409:31-408(+)